ncbi:MAG: biotin/lipoyl-containing protein, partial [Halanaerobiaceae bacterium]
MAEPIIMPRQGLSVESCILTEWKKDVGDQISKGDIVFTFETDKSTFEKEAEEEGVLLGKFFEPGDEVEVLTNVGVIGEEGEDIEEFRPGEKEEEVPETEEPSVEE